MINAILVILACWYGLTLFVLLLRTLDDGMARNAVTMSIYWQQVLLTHSSRANDPTFRKAVELWNEDVLWRKARRQHVRWLISPRWESIFPIELPPIQQDDQ
jgi:hypothetical protein